MLSTIRQRIDPTYSAAVYLTGFRPLPFQHSGLDSDHSVTVFQLACVLVRSIFAPKKVLL